MSFVIGITIAVVLYSTLASMVKYYLPLMTIDSRKLWFMNISFLGIRQLIALIEPVVANITHYDVTSTFKLVNYMVNIGFAISFMIYLQKRYSKEAEEKQKIK